MIVLFSQTCSIIGKRNIFWFVPLLSRHMFFRWRRLHFSPFCNFFLAAKGISIKYARAYRIYNSWINWFYIHFYAFCDLGLFPKSFSSTQFFVHWLLLFSISFRSMLQMSLRFITFSAKFLGFILLVCILSLPRR